MDKHSSAEMVSKVMDFIAERKAEFKKYGVLKDIIAHSDGLVEKLIKRLI